MAKTRDKVYDTAENIKPYVERAMTDDKLRTDVMKAFQTAKELYDDIRDKVRDALEDLRSASDRLQGNKSHSGRNTTILIAGLALGILYNPVTGRETRRFIKDMISGGDSSPTDFSSGNGHG
jgi:hypothetical protein